MNVTPYRTILGYNSSSSVNVTAQDQGNVPEAFNVILLIGEETVNAQTVSLLPNETTTLRMPWTAPNNAGDYVIVADASDVSGETDLADKSSSSAMSPSRCPATSMVTKSCPYQTCFWRQELSE